MDGKVLIVEDDATLLEALRYNLGKEGHAVVTAQDGAQALETARREKPDLIILDLMLPKLSGLEVCRILRKDTKVPILMLTAKTDEIDKVVGLEMGADDYMTKPFSMRELLARVRAGLRRADMARPTPADDLESIRVGDLDLDTARHRITFRGSQLTLTAKEYDLLVFLARNKGFVFSREQLLDKVWGYDYAGDTRTVDVHVRWLRQKIEADPAHPRNLITVRGAGYKLEG
jgi:two-component system, OmpR family, response regulator